VALDLLDELHALLQALDTAEVNYALELQEIDR
jgi:hypothetical protein